MKQKERKSTKVVKIIVILVLGIVCVSLLYKNLFKNQTKNLKIGNNNTSQEIIQNLLDISSYEAIIDVTVYSNKNENRYKIRQIYENEKNTSQEIIEPTNIAGIKITQEGENLKIENSKLSLTNIIENYQYISSNNLDLSSFIEDYKNDSRADYEENENEIKMYAVGDTNNNSDSKCKKTLYIDKKTNLPKQLEIEWTNKNNKVYILYNEVEIK